MTGFSLDPRLQADTVPVCDLQLSAVRLMRDSHYPWLVLVPGRPGLVEITDLDETNRARLMEEIALAARALKAVTGAHKLNLAALGNRVRQLHVHVIARFEDDAAWPDPVWSGPRMKPYGAGEMEALVQRLADAFGVHSKHSVSDGPNRPLPG